MIRKRNSHIDITPETSKNRLGTIIPLLNSQMMLLFPILVKCTPTLSTTSSLVEVEAQV